MTAEISTDNDERRLNRFQDVGTTECSICGDKGYVVRQLVCGTQYIPCICTPCGQIPHKPLVEEVRTEDFDSFGKT